MISTIFAIATVAFTLCTCTTASARQAKPRGAVVKPFGTCVKGGKGRVPGTLDEAMTELKRILGKETARFKKTDPVTYHHGLGTALRNCWGLWAGGSALGRWFNKRGIKHPDDMSSIVLTSLHRKLNKKSIDLKRQIAGYKAYWSKRRKDYESGASSGSSLFNLVGFVKGQGWVSFKGEKIPRIYDLVTPLTKFVKSPVTACWKKFPKTPGNSAVDTSIKIHIDKAGRLASAKVVRTALPRQHALCIAKALEGASIPKHAGARFTLIFQTYRMGHSKKK